MIHFDGLTKQYGNVIAVDNLSLHIPAGKVHGLLGPNGAGKTTTVRILSTLTKPTKGSVKVGGYNVAVQPLKVKQQIGVVHQTLNFDPELTGEESLRIHGMLSFFVITPMAFLCGAFFPWTLILPGCGGSLRSCC